MALDELISVALGGLLGYAVGYNMGYNAALNELQPRIERLKNILNEFDVYCSRAK